MFLYELLREFKDVLNPREYHAYIEELNRLYDNDLFLFCLEEYGIENWHNYKEACEMYNEEKEKEY